MSTLRSAMLRPDKAVRGEDFEVRYNTDLNPRQSVCQSKELIITASRRGGGRGRGARRVCYFCPPFELLALRYAAQVMASNPAGKWGRNFGTSSSHYLGASVDVPSATMQDMRFVCVADKYSVIPSTPPWYLSSCMLCTPHLHARPSRLSGAVVGIIFFFRIWWTSQKSCVFR